MILILSICTAEVNEMYQFHFKGVYNGELIKNIFLKNSESLSVGKEYLLVIKAILIKEGRLIGEVVKSWELDKKFYSVNEPNYLNEYLLDLQ